MSSASSLVIGHAQCKHYECCSAVQQKIKHLKYSFERSDHSPFINFATT